VSRQFIEPLVDGGEFVAERILVVAVAI
jgi:hypothetical protein